jgi:hypothetical protein
VAGDKKAASPDKKSRAGPARNRLAGPDKNQRANGGDSMAPGDNLHDELSLGQGSPTGGRSIGGKTLQVERTEGLEKAPDAAEGTAKMTTRKSYKTNKKEKIVDNKSQAAKTQQSKKDMKSTAKLVGEQQKKPEEPEYKSNTGLSKRGVQALLPTKDEQETQLSKVSFNDAYDQVKNQNGYLNMLVEENHLMQKVLKAKL